MDFGIFKLLAEHLGVNKEAYLLLGIFLTNVKIINDQRVRNKEIDGKFETQNTKIKYIEGDSKEAKKESRIALDLSKDTKRLVETIRDHVSVIDNHVNSIDEKVETVIIKLEEKYEKYGRRKKEDQPSQAQQ